MPPPSAHADRIERLQRSPARLEAAATVFASPARVIDVGHARRALRRAVQVRDRGCFHPLGDQPVERCQVDHVEPWAAGGRTTEANGRLACRFHNRARHQGHRRADRAMSPVLGTSTSAQRT